MPRSALVREALDSYLRMKSNREGISVLELAGDLVGCVEGPDDLSYNKEYMKDFGKGRGK